MIIDCFPYFNERELLELRLTLLYDHVDLFVITEGDHTHRGIPKALTCRDVLREIGIDQSKIRVVTVNMPSYEEEPNPWVRERMQRDAAAEFIGEDDIAFVSDCDEIVNPKYIQYYADVAKKNSNGILRVPLAFLCGRADLRVRDRFGLPIPWNTPFVCMKNHVDRYTLSEIRESHALGLNNIDFKDVFTYDNGVLEEAGWHMTWMGDQNRLKIKEASYLHWNEVSVLNDFNPRVGSTDPLGRNDHILSEYDTSLLPKEVFDLPRVKRFLLPRKTLSVVQIGTNRANDDLAKHIHSMYDDLDLGVFVEPNPLHKKSIEECYERYSNVHVETIGIKSPRMQEDSMNLYLHTDDGPGYEIASLNIDHIKKHIEFVPHLKNGSGFIASFIVHVVTLTDLFDKYQIKELDWLLLDVEGIDAEIIETFDWSRYKIRRVEFEYIHLGDRAEVIDSMFTSLGYKRVPSLHKFDWAYELI